MAASPPPPSASAPVQAASLQARPQALQVSRLLETEQLQLQEGVLSDFLLVQHLEAGLLELHSKEPSAEVAAALQAPALVAGAARALVEFSAAASLQADVHHIDDP